MVLILVPPYLCSASWFLGVGIHCCSILPSIGICELKSVFPHWSCSCICHRKEKFASTLAGTQITWKAVSTWNRAQIFTVTLFKWLELLLLPSSNHINVSCLYIASLEARNVLCSWMGGWVTTVLHPDNGYHSVLISDLSKHKITQRKISLE